MQKSGSLMVGACALALAGAAQLFESTIKVAAERPGKKIRFIGKSIRGASGRETIKSQLSGARTISRGVVARAYQFLHRALISTLVLCPCRAHLDDMTHAPQPQDLIGKVLIAMPAMGDTRFGKSVVYLCAHSEDGAMGLIVNKPAPEVKFTDLLKQLSIPGGDGDETTMIYFGGPVETGRGFVLHSSDYSLMNETLAVNTHFGMTATRDILRDMAQGKGPAHALLALGYAGWGAGQLEAELQQNGWLVADAVSDIVFSSDSDGKWSAALKSLGVDPSMLSAEGGRA